MNSTTNYEALRQAALFGYGVAVLLASKGKDRDAVRDLREALKRKEAKCQTT